MIHVTCAIILHGELILAVRHSETKKMPLKWEFPAGKFEEQEEGKEGISREIQEEVNITMEVHSMLCPSIHGYGNFKIQLIPYLATIQSGKIKLKNHKTHRWLPKDALLDLEWAAAEMPVVHEFLRLTK